MPKPASDPELPALPPRRRLLIVALAVAVALAVMALLIVRPGDAKRGVPRALPEAAPCKPGQSTGCVGGRAEVIVLPPAAASRP